MNLLSLVIGGLLLALAGSLFFGLDLLFPLVWVWNALAGLLKFVVYDLAPLWFVLLFVFALSQRPLKQQKWRGM